MYLNDDFVVVVLVEEYVLVKQNQPEENKFLVGKICFFVIYFFIPCCGNVTNRWIKGCYF
jgi:hypothetical protein